MGPVGVSSWPRWAHGKRRQDMVDEMGGGLDHTAGIRDTVKCCGLSGLHQLVEQRLRALQVVRVEAFGKPVVDRSEEVTGLGFLALA